MSTENTSQLLPLLCYRKLSGLQATRSLQVHHQGPLEAGSCPLPLAAPRSPDSQQQLPSDWVRLLGSLLFPAGTKLCLELGFQHLPPPLPGLMGWNSGGPLCQSGLPPHYLGQPRGGDTWSFL